MSLESQAKLLRVLEEKEIRRLGGGCDIKVDVRIISSINTMPQIALQKNQLREDLFYRLSVTTIVIPPIKDRPQDIDLLTNHFIQKFNRTYKKKLRNLSPEVHEFFISYPWPGNVRQLKHVIESAISSIPPDRTEIRMHDMPHYLFDATTTYVGTLQGISTPSLAAPASPASPAPTAAPVSPATAGASQPDISQPEDLQPETLYTIIEEKEKQKILDALLQTGGNISKAARQLGISRQSFPTI